MEALKTIIPILESYRGRDRIMRLFGFGTSMLSGCTAGKMSTRFLTFSAELSQCRTVLRLFDDLSMLGANLKFFLGPKDPNKVVTFLQGCSNLLFQLYFPVEHIAWLSDKHILSGVESGKYKILCVTIWAVCLVMEIIRSLIKIARCKKMLISLKKQEYLGDAQEKDGMTEQAEALKEQKKKTQAELSDCYCALFQSVFDLLNAVHWIPGVGWSLSQFKSGLFGTISSAFILYRNWPAKQAQPSKSS